MRSFDDRLAERIPLNHGIAQTLLALGESKGHYELYTRQMPQVLETLRQAAIIQSTESSNRIEQITAPLRRIQDLIAQKTTPVNRSEEEIAGYRDVLTTIHSSYRDMPFTVGLVLQLHRDLYRHTQVPGGVFKMADNEISERYPDGTVAVRFRPVSAVETPVAMAHLHERFLQAWNAGDVGRLLLIPAYVLDFLCIHPFTDGNGRMARLLTLLLLYHAGYEVGRYISLERIVERSRETYYEALGLSSAGWHEGQHSLLPWTEYFLGVLTAAHKDLAARVGKLTSARGTKRQMVLDAIVRAYGTFTVAELQATCPNVSVDFIRLLLKQEREAGRVTCLDRGPKARWRRV
ncbi:MAG TPA: Fic family protein [Thermoanaerobaculaceae bacterium]|nr:Fic family protein [Thermoanaerobaculaceae bacterium]